jgi:hypothetical protein
MFDRRKDRVIPRLQLPKVPARDQWRSVGPGFHTGICRSSPSLQRRSLRSSLRPGAVRPSPVLDVKGRVPGYRPGTRRARRFGPRPNRPRWPPAGCPGRHQRSSTGRPRPVLRLPEGKGKPPRCREIRHPLRRRPADAVHPEGFRVQPTPRNTGRELRNLVILRTTIPITEVPAEQENARCPPRIPTR